MSDRSTPHGVRAHTRRRRTYGEAPGRAPGDDRGITTIEVVILAPVMFLFILVLVAFGQLVEGRGGLDGAARDAVRAASLQRSEPAAETAAQKAANAQLKDICVGGVTVNVKGWPSDEQLDNGESLVISADVSCEIKGLAMLGLDIKTTMEGQAAAPLDPYRRAN